MPRKVSTKDDNKKTDNINNDKEIVCSNCGETLNVRFFYQDKSENTALKYYPFCKTCTDRMCLDEKTGKISREHFKKLLKRYDKPFLQKVYDSVLRDKRNGTMGLYLSRLNNKQYNGLSWKDSDTDENISQEKVETITQDTDNCKDDKVSLISDIEVTVEDAKIQKDIFRLLGYDPFDGYAESDKKFLNAELLPYLDEDTLDDKYKISIILQIVNNTNQIRKIDLVINKLSSDVQSLLKNHTEIKSLTAIKNQIGQVNDKLSKENAIAIKHRGDMKAGKSTLGSMMKDLRELDFEKAEHNYYTMKLSYGMKYTADISHKSIVDILHFDSNDEHNIFKMQRELIQKMQDSELEFKEEIRRLLLENKELKNKIDEFQNK